MSELSGNEAKVLSELLEDGFATDTKIAKKIGLTVQGVGKIRKKLLSKAIIKGLHVELDLEKLGIDVLAIAFLKVSPDGLKGINNALLKEIVGKPNSMCVLSLSSQSEGNLFLKAGFRNLKECEAYFSKLEKDQGRLLEIKKLHVCSSEALLKDSRKDLFRHILREP